jgi:hypothetical protein
MSTQGKGDGGFKVVTFALLGVIHSQLSYPLRTNVTIVAYISKDKVFFQTWLKEFSSKMCSFFLITCKMQMSF